MRKEETGGKKAGGKMYVLLMLALPKYFSILIVNPLFIFELI